MSISTVNPATGQLVRQYETHRPDQVEAKLDTARAAQREWAALPVDGRAERIAPIAALLRERVDTYAELLTLEMGKPIEQARAEVLKCATCVDHYVDQGAAYLAPLDIPVGVRSSGVHYRPLGVVLAVMPWNYPFWQVLRCAVPSLVAGNGLILKHASNVPGAALALETLVADAGLPMGLFGTVLIESGDVAALIHDDRIAGVSLTGSERVGRLIGSAAGQALKPAVLELGGSDPYVVLDDADIGAAAAAAVTARMQNNGQSCIAAKRFIVHAAVHDTFVDAFVAELQQMRLGDPFDPEVALGPMARADLRDELHQQVAQTVSSGARTVIGGEVPGGDGAFYPATLLDGVTPGMVGFDEELFGPAGVVVRAADDEQIVQLANHSRYGLGSSIWGGDIDRAVALGQRLETGMVFVNEFVRSDPRLPFGGVKASGFGRELGQHGILEFVNAQTLWVA